MNSQQSEFVKTYFFGLFVFCGTSMPLVFGYCLSKGEQNFLTNLIEAIVATLLVTPFYMSVVSIVCLVIGGASWKILTKLNLNISLKATLAGGFSGSLFIAAFNMPEITGGSSGAITTIASLFLLGAWCGWAGERLARRYNV